jgi:hypothetical protein
VVQNQRQVQQEPVQEDLGFNSDDVERVSVMEEGGTEIRTYYVRKEQPKYIDVEDVQYKVNEKIVEVSVPVDREEFKDIPVEVINTVVVEEEEVIVQKKDIVKDVIKDIPEDVIKEVPKKVYKTVQKYKDVPKEVEVIQEVDVEVFRDKEVEVIREVEVPNYVNKEVEVIQDVYEDEEKSEVFQKVIENEREVEINITKLKPKYKEIPVDKYTDVEVEVRSYNPVESVQTVNKTKDMYVPKKVEKIVEKPVYIDKTVEKVYEKEIIKEVPVYRERIVEKKVPVYVDKRVNVPYKKYVEKAVIKEVDREYEIEVIEEKPVLMFDEEENITNVDLKNTRLKEILEENNRQKNSLMETSEQLHRELRKSHKRNQERKSQTKKVYNYVGKEQNQELRNELTNLHKEFKNTVKLTTQNQIEELKNSEIVKKGERRRMDDCTVQELKKSGVITQLGNAHVIPESQREYTQVEQVVTTEPVTEFQRNVTQVSANTDNVSFNDHVSTQRSNSNRNYENMISRTVTNTTSQVNTVTESQPQQLIKNQSQQQETETMTLQGRPNHSGNIFPEKSPMQQPQRPVIPNLNISQETKSHYSTKRSINLNSYKSKGLEEVRVSSSRKSLRKQQPSNLVYSSVITEIKNEGQEQNPEISQETQKVISEMSKQNQPKYDSVDALAKKMMIMGENNQ